ncbi:MaoC/PaaZ C-terminal domain-containing protein [Neobacillus sp. 114]|uniref:MaoC/PaaZ C-terminal domain-containing protein n=1 Tax=Neobacillus sp. 114 TaxID=3048535 RepID=UPI0024C38C4B|nr:MaoC/PaaZ C-terminal domain-containing protein [Neobacillus sp. 114]
MALTIDQLFIGQIARSKRIFTDTDVKLCIELTNDISPIYQANEKGWENFYRKPIVPGLLTEGLITQVISQKLPGSPCILLQKELVFIHPVHAGDEVMAELEIIDINLSRNWVTQKVTCYNQTGTEVVKGQVVLLVLSNQGS